MLSTVLLFHWAPMEAQQTEKVHWLSFEELEDSLNVKPKKVFISFTTDWCTYCRKMDKVVFTKPEVIELLNTDYYAVHFDAEYDSVVTFGERPFINDQLEKSRTPIHQIAQLLALREGQFVAPTMVILDEDFKLIARHFEYLDSRRLIKALE
ncbi:MAG: thioredoxin fold domain-containing protein [Bacteroidota bacterium]